MAWRVSVRIPQPAPSHLASFDVVNHAMLVRLAEDDWTFVESEQQGQHAYVL